MSGLLHAQQVIVLHPKVGGTLDAFENSVYAVFPDVAFFKNAQFVALESDSVIAVIELRQPVYGNRFLVRRYSAYEFHQFRQKLDFSAPLPQISVKTVKQIEQPVWALIFMSRIPYHAICEIKTRENERKRVVFERITDRSFDAWMNRELHTYPFDQLKIVRYWTKYNPTPALYWSVVGLSGLTIAASVYTIAGFSDYLNPHRMLLAAGGFSAGCIAGSYAAPLIDDLVFPSYIINFETGRIKRLDTLQRIGYNLRKLKDYLWQLLVEQPKPA